MYIVLLLVFKEPKMDEKEAKKEHKKMSMPKAEKSMSLSR
jgi:hypothetical protein